MSMAPRPQRKPSTISAPKGSRSQPAGSTGTTSVWPTSASEGAVGSLPSIRTTREARSGCGSTTTPVRPEPSKKSCSVRTVRSSCPESAVPSLTHSLRMSSLSSSVVWSAREGRA
jgi:hypothetical protein